MESVTPSILKKLMITVLIIGYRKIPRNKQNCRSQKYNDHRFILLQINTSFVSYTISTDCYASLRNPPAIESADFRKALMSGG